MNYDNNAESGGVDDAQKTSTGNSFNITSNLESTKKSNDEHFMSQREDGSTFFVSGTYNSSNYNNNNNNNNAFKLTNGTNGWNHMIGNGVSNLGCLSGDGEPDSRGHIDYAKVCSIPLACQPQYMSLTQQQCNQIPLMQYGTLAINTANFTPNFNGNVTKCDMKSMNNASMNNNIPMNNNLIRLNSNDNLSNASERVTRGNSTNLPFSLTQSGDVLQECPWVDEMTSPEDAYIMGSGVVSPPITDPITGLPMGLVNIYNNNIPMIGAHPYHGHMPSMDYVPHSPFFASFGSESSSVSQTRDGLMPSHQNSHSYIPEDLTSHQYLKSPREKDDEPTQFTPYPHNNYGQRSNSSSLAVNGSVSYHRSPSESYHPYEMGIGQQMTMPQHYGSGRAWGGKGARTGSVTSGMSNGGPWVSAGLIGPHAHTSQPQAECGAAVAPSSTAKSQFVEKFRDEHVQKNWTLNDIEGHIVEIAKDQEGSRFVQTLMDYSADNGTSEEVIDRIIKELFVDEKVAHDVISDVFGNYVVQKIFEMSSVTQMNAMTRCIIPCLIKLTLQTYGCRVVQKVVEITGLYAQKGFTESQQLTDMILIEVKGHVPLCVQDQNGNHVIQKCLEAIPSKSGFIIDYFKGRVRELATHAYGCRVVQCILQHCKNDEPWIMREIFLCLPELSMDQYGNYVVQHVIQHGSRKYVNTVFDLMKGNIYHCSKHKFASNVMEKLYVKVSKAQKEELFNILSQPETETTCPEQLTRRTEGKPLLSYFVLMMMNSYANYVVQKIVDESTDAIRQKMMTHTKLYLDVLRTHYYGKHIIARFERCRYLPVSGGGSVGYGGVGHSSVVGGVGHYQLNSNGNGNNNNRSDWQGHKGYLQ